MPNSFRVLFFIVIDHANIDIDLRCSVIGLLNLDLHD
jgi:hypothetical protein